MILKSISVSFSDTSLVLQRKYGQVVNNLGQLSIVFRVTEYDI